MKKTIVLLIVLNTTFFSAAFLRRRSKRSLGTDSSELETIIEPFNFTQKVDHFNKENHQKWDQRFWVSRTHYKTGGPAFLEINGEWAVDSPLAFSESWVSYGKKLNAFCFTLEHRYYGESWPGNDYFRHLSSAQALADVANFIIGATEQFQLPKDTKWIVFGCSYGGILATWARLKYPHLIHGAVASSAPLLCKTDYDDYFRVVEKSLKTYDPECIASITRFTNELDHLINTTEDVKNISRMFHFCDDQEDIVSAVKTLLSDMVDIFSTAVQSNNTFPLNIPRVCDIMINHNGTKLEAFEKLRQMYLNYLKDEYDIYDFAAQSYSYQVCSEIGGFYSYNKTISLSGLSHLLPIENVIKEQCGEFFGPKFGINEMNEKMNQANFLYGGLDFNVRNTLFIHGSLDPWHTSGIYRKTNGSLYETIFINGSSHCEDYYAALGPNEIPELKEAREKTVKIIEKWLMKT